VKVGQLGNAERPQKAARESEARGAQEAKPLVFQKTLSSLSAEQRETRLAELIQSIDEQGEKLSKRADIKELERYRALIRDFLDDVVSNGYSYSKENGYASRGRRRSFATVKTIDTKLDELAKQVLSDQADQLTLMDKIGDIRGLILDMLL
jgi:uncharacterized protein YaaR (DUF327 family)